MSKKSYIIKFNDKDEYENHKHQLIASSEYDTIDTRMNFWILHYLTNEEYDKIKSYGINITLDDDVLTTC
jgi:plasmid rolling circle replication initiator protein Rep